MIFSFLIATYVMSVFLLTCYVCSTKIGENSDISKCFENFVSQALGVLTRIYAAELRLYKNFPNEEAYENHFCTLRRRMNSL